MYQRPCDSWYNKPMEKKNKLLLIDGSSVAFRAFFALYHQIDRFKNANGLHTNAVYGFNLMLSHILERIQPTHVLVAFDAGKTTFRTEMYADYKGGRAKLQMSSVSSFLSFVSNWIIWESAIMSWPSMKRMILLEH